MVFDLTVKIKPVKFSVRLQLISIHSEKCKAIRQSLSAKYLRIQYPSKFAQVKILHYTVYNDSHSTYAYSVNLEIFDEKCKF